jgi:hypothetical protein
MSVHPLVHIGRSPHQPSAHPNGGRKAALLAKPAQRQDWNTQVFRHLLERHQRLHVAPRQRVPAAPRRTSRIRFSSSWSGRGLRRPRTANGLVAWLPVKGTACHFVIRFAHPLTATQVTTVRRVVRGGRSCGSLKPPPLRGPMSQLPKQRGRCRAGRRLAPSPTRLASERGPQWRAEAGSLGAERLGRWPTPGSTDSAYWWVHLADREGCAPSRVGPLDGRQGFYPTTSGTREPGVRRTQVSPVDVFLPRQQPGRRPARGRLHHVPSDRQPRTVSPRSCDGTRVGRCRLRLCHDNNDCRRVPRLRLSKSEAG